MCWIYSVVFVVRLWWHGDTFGHRPGMTFLHQVCERNIQTFLHRRNLNCRSARIQSLWCNTRRIIPVNSNCLAGIWKGHLEVPQPQELRIPSNHAYEPLTKWGQSPMVYRRKFTGKEHLGESTWNTCKTGHRYICQRSNNASSKANPLKNVHSIHVLAFDSPKKMGPKSPWSLKKNTKQLPSLWLRNSFSVAPLAFFKRKSRKVKRMDTWQPEFSIVLQQWWNQAETKRNKKNHQTKGSPPLDLTLGKQTKGHKIHEKSGCSMQKTRIESHLYQPTRYADTGNWKKRTTTKCSDEANS